MLGYVHITMIATYASPLSGEGTFHCDQTRCNTFKHTPAAAIIATPDVIVKFEYTCVSELWCMGSNVPATKCTSERMGDPQKTNLKTINTPLSYQWPRPPHWPPLYTPWSQPDWMCMDFNSIWTSQNHCAHEMLVFGLILSHITLHVLFSVALNYWEGGHFLKMSGFW